jgi:hypothetical protein
MKMSKIGMLVNLSLSALTPMRAGNDEINLNVSYETMSEVPETFRSLYSEKDGKAVLSRVVGLKTQEDVNRIQGALEKERNDHRTIKSSLSRLGDRSIDDVLTLLDSIPALEAAAKGSENIDERLAGRLQQETAPLTRKINEYETTVGSLKEQLQTLQTREVHRDIGDTVAKYALSSKVLPEAVEDVQFIARGIFEKNEDGQIVAKANIPGVTAGISPEVWLTELQRSKPFYWPSSNLPTFRKGSNGSNVGNPWSKESWNMTEQGRMVRENRTKAEQMAAQAGSSIGAGKPS